MTSRAVDRFVARSRRGAVAVSGRRPAPVVVVEAADQSPAIPDAIGDPAPIPAAPAAPATPPREPPEASRPAAAPPTSLGDGIAVETTHRVAATSSTAGPPTRADLDRASAATPPTSSAAAPEREDSELATARSPATPTVDKAPMARLRLVGAEPAPVRAVSTPADAPTAGSTDNPIAARLEAAADRTGNRQPTELEPGPRADAVADRQTRHGSVPAVVAGERATPATPHAPTPATPMATPASAPTVLAGERATPPTVTIGTIEVITPAAPAPAPRALDALGARRRSGRLRWTGRAG